MKCGGAQQKWSAANLQQGYSWNYNETKWVKIILRILSGKRRVSNIPWSMGSSCSAEMSLVESREFIFTWSLESTVRSDQKWLISWKTCGEMTQTNSSYTRESGAEPQTALNDWPKRTIGPSLHQSQSKILCSTHPPPSQTCSMQPSTNKIITKIIYDKNCFVTFNIWTYL